MYGNFRVHRDRMGSQQTIDREPDSWVAAPRTVFTSSALVMYISNKLSTDLSALFLQKKKKNNKMYPASFLSHFFSIFFFMQCWKDKRFS